MKNYFYIFFLLLLFSCTSKTEVTYNAYRKIVKTNSKTIKEIKLQVFNDNLIGCEVLFHKNAEGTGSSSFNLLSPDTINYSIYRTDNCSIKANDTVRVIISTLGYEDTLIIRW